MKRQRSLLQVVLFLMFLGNNMYAIFLPLFFLQHGVPFKIIMFAMAAQGLGGIIASAVANVILHKLGIHAYVLMRGIFEPLLVLLIRFYPLLRFPIVPVGFFLGFVTFPFWISMDALVLKCTERESRGHQTGKIFAFISLAGVFAPLAGGIIVKYAGYSVMFITAFLLVLLGGILSLFVKAEIYVKKRIVWKVTLKGPIGAFMTMTFLRGIVISATSFLFGIFIFNHYPDEFIVGVFGLVFGLGSFASQIITGKWADKHDVYRLFTALHIFTALAWVFLGTGYFPSLFLILAHLGYMAVSTPNDKLFFDMIEDRDIISLNSERIMAVSFGITAGAIISAFVPMNSIFVLAGVVTMLSVPLIKKLRSE